ncbi:MAG: YncE family protein [Candidatus Velthaea sp.]
MRTSPTSSTSLSRKTAAAAALLLGAAGAAALLPARAASTVNYQVTKKFTVGGEGGWDYLTYDPAGRRLFISRTNRVIVVDPASGTTVGEIADTPGVHGIALAPELNKGFTSNGRDNTMTVFDLKTLKPLAKVALDGKNPDAILYDPATKKVFAWNGGSANASVIDAMSNAVVATIALPGRPEFAAADGNGRVYVNIEDKNEIVAVDARNNAVTGTWPLGACEGPAGLSIDVQHHRLFAGCSNKLMVVVDSDGGKMIATLPIGQGSDATAFDPGSQLAFSSNGEGTLTVVHEDAPGAFSVVQTATTQPAARTLAVDVNSHDVYLVTAQVLLSSPAPGQQRPARTIVPRTFTVLVVSNRP